MRFLIPLLATMLMVHAVPAAPGEAALGFMEKVRSRKVNLEPGGDTAITTQTAEGKRREIARRLDRMARDIGSDPLEVGTVREDGDFAAVLVRKEGGFDPSRMQVFPVALVKKDGGWTAAPVPASFENAGAGYSIPLRQRLETLENWMLRQQVEELEKLRARSAARMREKIEARLTVRQLQDYDVSKAGAAFLTACEQQDLATVLGLFGGLGTRLPDDWPSRLKAAERAFSAGPDAISPWRLLLAPDILRIPVHHEEQATKGLFSIACLDPAVNSSGSAEPRIHVLHLELSKSGDGLWQIDPAPALLSDPAVATDSQDDDTDTDLVQRFASEWTKTHPPTPQETAELALTTLIGTLRDSSPAKLLRMALLRTSPEDASADCLGATHFWSPFHDTAAFRHAIPLAMKTSGNEAVSLLQIFSSRETGQTDIRPVYFEKSSSGWLWTPLPRAGVMNEFKSWIETETGTWSEKWQDTLLSAVTVLDKNFLPPSQEEARSCVEAWLTAVRQGDLEKALSLSARFSAPKSTVTTLRNTGYEILAARRNREPASIRGIYQGHFWTAAGVITVLDKKPSHPLYAVVKTTAGPRILIETDLIASGNRSREYLNKEALGLVAKSAGTEAAADLRSLLDRYQSEIASGFDAPVPSK